MSDEREQAIIDAIDAIIETIETTTLEDSRRLMVDYDELMNRLINELRMQTA